MRAENHARLSVMEMSHRSDEFVSIATKAEQVKEFTLLRAYPDQKNDGLSLALEFSRPLVGTQDFDALVRFEEKVGTDDSSWTLSDDGKTLLLTHPNGLQPSAETSRIYKNQREHDPLNIHQAREIASSIDPHTRTP